MKLFVRTAITAAAAIAFAAPTFAQEKLTVWFTKGFYPAEDLALDEMVRKFEAKTGVKVDLSRYAVQEIIPKSVAALDSGSPPDVSFGHTYDFQVTSKWAFEGKLEDITDIMTPIKGQFLAGTAETTYLYSDKAKKKAYYAFPLEQQTMHINYWKDMLAEAGFKESDIPTQWKAYWDFWCDKVQPAYRAKTGKRVYAVGNPMGVDSTDTFYSFLTFADAWGVNLVDDNGKVMLDAKNRAAMINALRDYTSLYTRGCTPPSSTAWKDPDNNVAFHNKTIMMTHNATISIATKHLDDMNNQTTKSSSPQRPSRPGLMASR
jgi:multiple sugar transport system substrate-binding protein